jgi:hypothetical protein
MANEITVSLTLAVSNGKISERHQASFRADQATAAGPGPGYQVIGTTHEAIAVPDVANKGFAFIKNLDDTNFVEIGIDNAGTFVPLLRLKAGEAAVCRFSPTASIYARANTAPVAIHAMIYSE